jgi:hypothetical protein
MLQCENKIILPWNQPIPREVERSLARTGLGSAAQSKDLPSPTVDVLIPDIYDYSGKERNEMSARDLVKRPQHVTMICDLVMCPRHLSSTCDSNFDFSCL